jgi:hypothetical protein
VTHETEIAEWQLRAQPDCYAARLAMLAAYIALPEAALAWPPVFAAGDGAPEAPAP